MGKKKTSRTGRPPKPPEEQKNVMFQIRMTEEERAAIEAAAQGKASTWAREVLMRAAKKPRGKAG